MARRATRRYIFFNFFDQPRHICDRSVVRDLGRERGLQETYYYLIGRKELSGVTNVLMSDLKP
jgi:hypothetical protein